MRSRNDEGAVLIFALIITTTIALVVGALAMVALVVHERRVEDPVVALDLFASRSFTAGTLLVCLQNLVMYALVFEIPLVLEERFDLGAASHRVTAGFSHGMGRRMSVILAAFHEPEVLLLDEPFDGVDPLGVEATMEVIADARARGAAVLVSTHLRELAVDACQEAIVLRGGSAVAQMPASEMTGEAGADVYRALLD